MHATRHIVVVLVAGWLLAMPALLMAQQPTTEPASTNGSSNRVLVLPFEPLDGSSDAVDAVASAMRRNLIVDLGRARQFHTVEGEQVAPDQGAALEMGKARDAQFVVWGTVQLVEGRIRVTGQVLDVARADAVGKFKVTGSFRELFELQDVVAEQVRRRLETPNGNADEQPEAEPRSKPAPEVPAGEALRTRPQPLDPEWLFPQQWTDDELNYRYNYGYLASPYGYGYDQGYGYGCYPFGYGYGYGGYHPLFYRPWRPLYQHRYSDYSFRGIPDRRPYYGFGPRSLHSFSGPVPMRWYRPR
jgi:TolB-like protein